MEREWRTVREERPVKMEDGREVREFQLRPTDEGEMKGEIEDEVMKEEREIIERILRLLSPLKVPDSIETRLLD